MVPNTTDPESQRIPETNQEERTADKPSSGRSGSNKLEIKDLRAVFRNIEESKANIIKRIQEIHSASGDNARARAQTEQELKDMQDQLAESNGQLRDIKEEVSSLRTELNTAKGLLEEIDKTLA